MTRIFSTSALLMLAASLIAFPDASYVLAAPVGSHSATVNTSSAPNGTANGTEQLQERKQQYDNLAVMTGLSWQQLAAIDQYERTLSEARPKARPQLGKWSGLYITEEKWSGALNPDEKDEHPGSIALFGGIGKDGDGDGLAKRSSDIDLLYSEAVAIARYGSTKEDFAIGLWEYYQNGRSVQRIQQFTKLYEALNRLDLSGSAFPLPISSDYSYKSTWGSARGWGGRRSHEGTDIFADYGVPVRSTVYGVVEIKGWNAYGGWRVGIRDGSNRYHYYAHLSGFEKKLSTGDVVSPGQTIGWVGSSGYGKPGTSGKFPPHLHYGIYKDRGWVEWSFDPYPLLSRWERVERKQLARKK